MWVVHGVDIQKRGGVQMLSLLSYYSAQTAYLAKYPFVWLEYTD